MPVRRGDMQRAWQREKKRLESIFEDSEFENAIHDLLNSFGMSEQLLKQYTQFKPIDKSDTEIIDECNARFEAFFNLLNKKLEPYNKDRFVIELHKLAGEFSKRGRPVKPKDVILAILLVKDISEDKINVLNNISAEQLEKIGYQYGMRFGYLTATVDRATFRNERILVWSDQYSDETYEEWKEKTANSLLPNHIYLDITGLTIDDIQLYWDIINMYKGLLEDGSKLVRGRRKGEEYIKRSVLRGMTWEEIRKYTRENPKDITRLENEYVYNCGAANSAQRRKAIQNFYKQVIIHPEMRDLRLRIRKRGRPRKSEIS